MPFNEDSTLSFLSSTSINSRPEGFPALTILWHPDLSRIGAMFSFADVPFSRPLALSRLSPDFTCYTTVPGPVGDQFISRQAVVQFTRVKNGLRISPCVNDGSVQLDGQPFRRELAIDLHDPTSAHVLTLANRVVLCIHSAIPPVRTAAQNLGLIGNSDLINEIRGTILAVADLQVPVLILGESGTGKELTAAGIVHSSQRSKKPFIAVNMASLSSSTAVAEIFGHEKGAFTGATESRSGYFSEADGGTLLLDEIGLAIPDVQTALLRVIETGEIRALGARAPKSVDVRLIAATDSQLERQVELGNFSEALLHRITSFKIQLPPLRSHRQDIGLLFSHFLRDVLKVTGDLSKLEMPSRKPWLSGEAMAMVSMAHWPGNVRQLRNFATQLVVTNRGADRARLDPTTFGTLFMDLKSIGKHYVKPDLITPETLRNALEENNYGPTATARALGVSKTTIYKLIERDQSIGKAADISDVELNRLREECGGDHAKMAQLLNVSLRGLKLRLTKRS